MPDQVLSALIAGLVSAIGAALTFYAVNRQLRQQRELAERNIEAKHIDRLYEIRLRCYAKAFEITESVKFDKDENESIISKLQEARSGLKAWKSGEPYLVMSHYTMNRLWDLERSLKRNPAAGINFSDEQIQKIWNARMRFRGALRRDLGLMLGEKDRGQFPGENHARGDA